MIITIAMLRKARACPQQVRLFKKLFGNQVRVTKTRCKRHFGDFDWDWAALNLLSPSAWRSYKRARWKLRASSDQMYAKGQAMAFAAAVAMERKA